MQPYLAMIVPVSNAGGGEHPSQPIHHPGHPDHGLPSGGYPSHGLPQPPLPGWGGGWGSGNYPSHGLPGSPGHPDHGLPPSAQPKSSMYAGVPESSIPSHADKPNPESGEWVLVALGDRSMAWAWMEAAAQPKDA
jgi:hypothetical protein